MEQNNKVFANPAWFNKPGPEHDVIISSRVRFARNLADYPFPHKLSGEKTEEVNSMVLDAFSRLPGDKHLTILRMDDLSDAEKSILVERNLITEEYGNREKGVIAMDDEGDVCCMLNDEDHLRISCIKCGLNLEDAYQKIDSLDNELENYVSFASTVEWGYLTSSLKNLGTAVRFSVLVHLPALELSSLLKETLKLIMGKGFQVKTFPGIDDISAGNIYQISNRITFGYDEQEILAHMIKLIKPLVLLERKTREAFYQKKKNELEDRILRTLGILKYCRMISLQEALELLSIVRLGACLGLVNSLSLEKITMLFFLSQNPHISRNIDDKNTDHIKSDSIRAGIIRDNL